MAVSFIASQPLSHIFSVSQHRINQSLLPTIHSNIFFIPYTIGFNLLIADTHKKA